MAVSDTHRAIEAVWRLESARIVAGLARLVRDVDLAEELAQDALVAALEQWPAEGIPPNPGAWLTVIAKRRAVDRLRRLETLERKRDQIEADVRTAGQPSVEAEVEAALDDAEVGDDLLRLMFIACHPVLSTEARVALTLRLLGGLTTGEIARAFLQPEATIAQRIVRAKRTLGSHDIPFELPPREQRAERLASVLEVIYLVFNEGYAATGGEDWTRPELCHEALRLGRILAGIAPDDAEVHGLAALMEIQASRLRARVGPSGEPVPLLEQNRGRWDRLLILRGFAALLRAERIGGPPGQYVVQAAIAACHARARAAEETDWAQIAALYDVLGRVAPSPVVRLNHAVAVSMASGPAEGLELVDELTGDPALKDYHLLPTVRGDLLAKLGRHEEARTEFERAASLARNAREQAVLLGRAAAATSAS